MNMSFALLARFESPVIQLKDISEEFFGISPRTAQQKANAGEFPVPTFKALDSERSPMLVNIADLAEYLEKRYKEGRNEWQQVNG
ncbi:pyocin activator PrtN family protein [Pseudoalteromonas sp. MMG005]|uniref:pyocin activator PrtN family protein n=1 Tax=Pseudoalteromonas sp. MMG005 TaxID=2822682 RepID=UPI001B3A00A9|nr:pyocin activator PrtN family protein [Pseudoalteromonas sp. MMG005]MBQ4844396.1 pyocin activator PrtN family protein [Pseudoalteromonas sp. MMG005]